VIGSRFTNSSAATSTVFATTPKSPAIHVARIDALICSIGIPELAITIPP
jgi:hypothetical protein